MAAYQYMIGTTQASMTNVEELSVFIPAPKSSFRPYSRAVNLGNGMVRGAGYAVATWHWGFLTLAQRDVLKAFCSGTSSTVWIRTKINDGDAYVDAEAVMVWPESEERESRGIRLDFTIEFRLYSGYTPVV